MRDSLWKSPPTLLRRVLCVILSAILITSFTIVLASATFTSSGTSCSYWTYSTVYNDDDSLDITIKGFYSHGSDGQHGGGASASIPTIRAIAGLHPIGATTSITTDSTNNSTIIHVSLPTGWTSAYAYIIWSGTYQTFTTSGSTVTSSNSKSYAGTIEWGYSKTSQMPTPKISTTGSASGSVEYWNYSTQHNSDGSLDVTIRGFYSSGGDGQGHGGGATASRPAIIAITGVVPEETTVSYSASGDYDTVIHVVPPANYIGVSAYITFSGTYKTFSYSGAFYTWSDPKTYTRTIDWMYGTPEQPVATPTPTLKADSQTKITVSWTAVTNASNYTLQYATNSSFSNPTTLTVTGTSKSITELQANTTYYVRMKANTTTANYIDSEYSATKSVKTKKIVLTSPSLNSITTINSSELSISYEKSDNATGYVIEYSTDAAFVNKQTFTI